MRTADTADKVEQALLAALIAGELKPGDTVPEARVARRVGVSRTPVREAVRRLVAAGVFAQEPNRAPTVRRTTAADLAHLYDLRIELEGYATAQAALTATPAQQKRLRAAAEVFGEIAASLTPASVATRELLVRVVQAEQAFHAALNEAANNPWLEQLLAQTNLCAAVFLRLAFPPWDGPPVITIRRSYRRHRHLVHLIAAGEADAARACHAAYLRETRDLQVARVRHRESLETRSDVQS